MKIGILSYHRSCNFGANLQVCSSYNNIKKMGYEPILIDYYPDSLRAFSSHGIEESQVKIHDFFIEDNFAKTNLCKSSKEISAELSRLGIKNVLIGSDALFNIIPFLRRFRPSKKTLIRYDKPIETLRFPNPFWGDFALPDTNIQTISVSSQAAPYKFFAPSTRRKIGEALLKMNFVSVRDEWTKSMVEYFTKKRLSPEITPDPVFGFNLSNTQIPSEEDIEKKFGLSAKKYVLFGFRKGSTPPKAWLDELSALFKTKGLQIKWLIMPEKVEEGIYENLENLTPFEWYALIKYSAAYIGNNMHPIVAALHNAIPFFSFDAYYSFSNADKASKTLDIVKRADFEGLRTVYSPRKKICPAAYEVFKKIENFDSNKSENFAQLQAQRYMQMMQTVSANFTA